MEDQLIKYIVVIVVKTVLVISAIAFAVAGVLDKDNQTDYFIISNLIWILNLFFNPKEYDS